MRIGALIVWGLLGSSVARAEPCRFDPVEGLPPLRSLDRAMSYQRRLVCPGPAAEGALEVELWSEGAKEAAEHKSFALRPNGRWQRTLKVLLRGHANRICRAAEQSLKAGDYPVRPGSRGVRVVGHPGEQRVVFPVPVEARVKGSGSLGHLSETVRSSLECEACPRPRGRVELVEGRAHARQLGPKSRLRVTVDPFFYRCVQPFADLSVRFFAAPERAALDRMFAPHFVMKRVHEGLKRVGSELVVEHPLDVGRICRGRAGQFVAWEIYGPSPLMRIGGGGRSVLRCP